MIILDRGACVFFFVMTIELLNSIFPTSFISNGQDEGWI
jgi:hypothetical protein